MARTTGARASTHREEMQAEVILQGNLMGVCQISEMVFFWGYKADCKLGF